MELIKSKAKKDIFIDCFQFHKNVDILDRFVSSVNNFYNLPGRKTKFENYIKLNDLNISNYLKFGRTRWGDVLSEYANISANISKYEIYIFTESLLNEQNKEMYLIYTYLSSSKI